MSTDTDNNFLPENYEEAMEIVLRLVRQHREIENCRRYPRSVANWLMTQSQMVKVIAEKILESDRLIRDVSDYCGPGLSDPKEPSHESSDMWSGMLSCTVYTPYGTNYRTISEW